MSLQVALDNTKKTLEVKQPHREPFDGEVDVDLYTDEHINAGKKEVVVNDDGSPRSLAWVTPSGASPPAVKTHSNGVTSSSASTRENICISHLSLNCQLTKTSPLELDTTRSSSASTRQSRRPNEEMRSDKTDLQPCSLQVEAMGMCSNEAETNHFCECFQPHDLQVRHCIECNTIHNVTCAWFQSCCEDGHNLLLPEEMQELAGVSPQGASLRARPLSASPPLSNSSTAMSSLALCDDPKSMSPTRHPISYHECCNLNRLNPQLLCFTCRVFHSDPCRDIDTCQTKHSIKELGLCSCGRACSRKPLVLCRYCGNEYCSPCWYRNPVVCTCGQTFDQSSSVWFCVLKRIALMRHSYKNHSALNLHIVEIEFLFDLKYNESEAQMLPWYSMEMQCYSELHFSLIGSSFRDPQLPSFACSVRDHIYHDHNCKSIVYCGHEKLWLQFM